MTENTYKLDITCFCTNCGMADHIIPTRLETRESGSFILVYFTCPNCKKDFRNVFECVGFEDADGR